MERVKVRLGFHNMEASEAEGWRGGTTILWRDHMGWEVSYFSKGITGITILDMNGGHWTLWACYCPVEKSKKSGFWETLTGLIKNSSKSWACIGDLNEVMDKKEKKRGRGVTDMSNFFLKNFMDELQGMDISFNGNILTW